MPSTPISNIVVRIVGFWGLWGAETGTGRAWEVFPQTVLALEGFLLSL